MLLVAVGGVAQPVVDVQRRDLGAEPQRDVEQAHRVGAAGEHHQQRLAAPDEAAVARGVERRVGLVAASLASR